MLNCRPCGLFVGDGYGAAKYLRERHHSFGRGHRQCAHTVLYKVVKMLVVAGIRLDHHVIASANHVALCNFGYCMQCLNDGTHFGDRSLASAKVRYNIKPYGFGIHAAL